MRVSEYEMKRVILVLRTPGSEEHNSYESGLASADFQLQTALQENAWKNKDAFDAFNLERRRSVINEALEDKFGLGDSEDI